MKNVVVISDPPHLETRIEDVPVPDYGDDEVLIKVICAGSNPKDWKHPSPKYFNVQLNQGDDVGGYVHKIGKNVFGFAVGDRVAGTYAEYTVCPSQTVFHLPDSVTFEEAATLPLAIYTAAVGLFRLLQLPEPWISVESKAPVIINGASSAVGAFAVKLAKLNPANAPVIGIAGANAAYAKTVGCDVVLDYRSESISKDLEEALDGKKASRIFDASNTSSSVQYLSKVLEKGSGKYVCTTKILPDQMENLKDFALARQIWVGCVHEDKEFGSKDFGFVWGNMFARLLAQGKLTGQPYEVIPGGLEGVEAALRRLMNRKGGNEKFVYRIAETPGLENHGVKG